MTIMIEKPYAEQRLMKYTRENASLEEATELVNILRRFKAELMAKRGTYDNIRTRQWYNHRYQK